VLSGQYVHKYFELHHVPRAPALTHRSSEEEVDLERAFHPRDHNTANNSSAPAHVVSIEILSPTPTLSTPAINNTDICYTLRKVSCAIILLQIALMMLVLVL
jgi:hypothetical protein